MWKMAKTSDPPRGTRRQKQAGFTLVELMVAVAIAAILAGTGAAYTLASLPYNRLKNAARVLYSQMQQARFSAIKENRQWQIVFPGGGAGAGTYQIVSGGPDRVIGGGDDVIAQTVILASYGSGIAYGSGNAANNWNNIAIAQRPSVTFATNGSCDIGDIYLTNQDNTISFALTTTRSGSIKMRKYNGILPFAVTNWMN